MRWRQSWWWDLHKRHVLFWGEKAWVRWMLSVDPHHPSSIGVERLSPRAHRPISNHSPPKLEAWKYLVWHYHWKWALEWATQLAGDAAIPIFWRAWTIRVIAYLEALWWEDSIPSSINTGIGGPDYCIGLNVDSVCCEEIRSLLMPNNDSWYNTLRGYQLTRWYAGCLFKGSSVSSI